MAAGIVAGILSGLNTLGQNQQAQQQQQIEAAKLGEEKVKGQLFTQMINSPEWKGMKPIDQWRALQDPSSWIQSQDFISQAPRLEQMARDPSLTPRVKTALMAAAAVAKAGQDPQKLLDEYKTTGLLGQDDFDKTMQKMAGTIAGTFAGLNMMPGMAGSTAPPPPGPGAVRGTQGGKLGYSYKGMFYTDDELKNATTTGP